jgi:transposase
MDMRELKALEIAARAKVVFDGTAWVVPSQTTGAKYRVTIGSEPSCSCDDFQLRQKPCKHIIAARLVQERDGGGKAPVMDTEVVPKKLTYRQNWPAYNRAQMMEKHRLQKLLYDLCRTIPQPERAAKLPGRKPVPLSDRVFMLAFKVYSTFSERRFNCDMEDAHKKGYLSTVVHPHKISGFFDMEELTPILKNLIVQSSLPLRAVETVFAPDSSGFSTSRFIRWYDEKYGAERSGREWVKAHIMTGCRTNIITAVEILDKNAGDCPQFKPLVETTAENFTVKEAVADKAYLSRENLDLIHNMGGTAYIPFKSNSVQGEAESLWEKMFFYFNFRREEFLKHYHQRSNVESTFSMVKAKFKDSVRSKTDTAMVNEVLCKFLCHNICCLIQAQCELGIEPVFWQNEPEVAEETDPDIIPMNRPG